MPRHHARFAPTGAALLSVACGLVLCGAAAAQPQQPGSALPNPRLITLVPAGGKAGTAVEVTFTGTDLEEPQTLLFSHPAIKAEPIVPPPPAAARPEEAAAKPAAAKPP